MKDDFNNLLYSIRSMLYLLTPNETYYEKMEDVPLLLDKVKQLLKIKIVIIKNNNSNYFQISI